MCESESLLKSHFQAFDRNIIYVKLFIVNFVYGSVVKLEEAATYEQCVMLFCCYWFFGVYVLCYDLFR